MAPKARILLKLLIDKKTKKVLFAEAGKDFVDFLFSLLALPIGAVAKFISTGTMRGSVGRLYESMVRNGAPSSLQAAMDKSDLLQLRVPPPGDGDLDQLQELLARFPLHTCPGRCMVVTVDACADCPECKHPMAAPLKYVLASAAPAPPKFGGGGVGGSGRSDESGSGYATYMVTDGLEVKPITSSILLIRRFIIRKDVDLAVHLVAVGKDEGLALIETALRSDTVLSDYFLSKN